MLGSQRPHCLSQDRDNQVWLTASRASGGKDKYKVRLTGVERESWMGTEISILEDCGF